MVRKLVTLVDDPSHRSVFHVRFTDDPPLACIEAPVTEFGITILKDTESLGAQERRSASLMSNMRTVQPEGLIAIAVGTSLDVPVLMNVYVARWNSIEVCVTVACVLY